MNENTDTELTDRLAGIAGMEPSVEDHQKAIAAIRAQLAKPTHHAFRWGRLAIAAVVAVAVVLGTIATWSIVFRPLSARAALLDALDATSKFEGSFTITMDDNQKTGRIIYNTTSAFAEAYCSTDAAGQREVRYERWSDGSMWHWTRMDNQITVGPMYLGDAHVSREEFYERVSRWCEPSIEDRIKALRSDHAGDDYTITASDENGLKRYDYKYYIVDPVISPQSPRYLFTYFIFWADPKSRLIVRVDIAKNESTDMNTKAGPITEATPWTHYTYHYNDPVLNDIYDAGVPHDAKIVDRRPSGRVKEVLDRLDQTIDAGFGDDGVAMAVVVNVPQAALEKATATAPSGWPFTTQQKPPEHSPSFQGPPSAGRLLFYARTGEQWSYREYNVTIRPGSAKSRPPSLADFPDWPKVDLASAIKAVEGRGPDLWRCGDATRKYESGDPDPQRIHRDEMAQWSLPGRLLPGTLSLHVVGSDREASIAKDGENEVLCVVKTRPDAGWNDMTLTLNAATGQPVELVDRANLQGAATAEKRRAYLEFVEGPGGRPILRRWRDSETYLHDPDQRTPWVQEGTLTVKTDLRAPDSWFTPRWKWDE